MIPQEILRKKRDGAELSTLELREFFLGLLNGQVADYQMSAMLMSILFNGMSARETADLTQIMRDSGEVWTWPVERTLLVDKHSTGGIGDKTSIVLLPLCALEGVKVPMMTGRGLGHTGGTVDKLESIPGFNQFLDRDKATKVMQACGGVFLAQSEKIAPLDRRLYALRDVTATVESVPLITASILSKKLAEGTSSLVMDIKYGSGAFMPDVLSAKRLAESIAQVGRSCGLNIRTLITSMNSPLGETAGNALEIFECLEVMQGRGPNDTRELTIALAEHMVAQAFPARSPKEIQASLRKRLASGEVYEAFLTQVRAQGGDAKMLEQPQKLLTGAAHTLAVTAANAGEFIQSIDVRGLGVAVQALGGGRLQTSDRIDHRVGLSRLKGLYDTVVPGEPLAIVHGQTKSACEEAATWVRSAYRLGREPSKLPVHELIAETII